jgi:hypothetical protein
MFRSSARASLRACAVLSALSLLLISACGSADADGNPADVLQHFLEAMDRSANNEAALKDAYALLDEHAQRELSARASRTSSLTGHVFAPWEMIAQGRFRLRFRPADHAELRASVKGDQAIVNVKGDDAHTHAAVPLVREGGQWRIKLELPELAARPAPTAP